MTFVYLQPMSLALHFCLPLQQLFRIIQNIYWYIKTRFTVLSVAPERFNIQLPIFNKDSTWRETVHYKWNLSVKILLNFLLMFFICISTFLAHFLAFLLSLSSFCGAPFLPTKLKKCQSCKWCIFNKIQQEKGIMKNNFTYENLEGSATLSSSLSESTVLSFLDPIAFL